MNPGAPCPCGCGVLLAGRQRAASPACRKRLERSRKAPNPEPREAIGALERLPETPKCDKILSRFEDSPFHYPPERRDFSAESYDPMEDLTLQPAFCLVCGGIYRRVCAYLICSRHPEHNIGIDCVGRLDHPRNEEWEAYLDANGREAFDAACDRSFRKRHPEYRL